jgi:hypothetical protein
MKKIYLIILAAITFGAVVFGSAYHMYGLFGNKDKTDEVVDVSYDFDSFKKIDVDAGLVDMTVTTGDKFSASFSGLKELLPEFKADNDTLEVYQRKTNSVGFNIFKPNKRNMHGVDNKLTITVPEGTALEEITFQCALGDADILGVSAKEMDIECAMGDIGIEDLSVDSIDLEADMGDVSLKNVDVITIDAELAMGNFEADLVKDISEYGLELDVAMGKCKVDGETVSNKYTKPGSNGTINVESAMGDVNIK